MTNEELKILRTTRAKLLEVDDQSHPAELIVPILKEMFEEFKKLPDNAFKKYFLEYRRFIILLESDKNKEEVEKEIEEMVIAIHKKISRMDLGEQIIIVNSKEMSVINHAFLVILEEIGRKWQIKEILKYK